MATLDVAVRAASTFSRTNPTLGGVAWNRRPISAGRLPDYLEAAIWDECGGVANFQAFIESGTAEWAKRTGVDVVIRVVAP